MVCVIVPLLLKQNIGVLFGVLRRPCSDAPPHCVTSYGSASSLWVLHIYYHCISVSPQI
jgi:hypothetical protein